jgi:hypothetical protein
VAVAAAANKQYSEVPAVSEEELTEIWRTEYATLPDEGLWDTGTAKAWSSDPKKGVAEKDWNMLHRDTWGEWELRRVGIARTVPPFIDIDTNSDGWVSFGEFGLFVKDMVSPIGPALLDNLERQHGMKRGAWLRWVGDSVAPWDGPAVQLSAIGRDLRGQVLCLVQVAGRHGPSVTWNSFPPGYEVRSIAE